MSLLENSLAVERDWSSRTCRRVLPLIALLLLSAIVLSAIGCGAPRTASPKTYRIGFGGDKPLHYVGNDGKPTGLAVDLVREAAKRRGINLTWVPGPGGLDKLKAGQLDLWVLMAILPERRALAHFSEPYLVTETAFLVPEGSSFHSVGDLANSRVAFNNVEIHRITLRRFLPNSTLLPLESTADALRAVADGRADAAYIDQYAGLVGLLDGVVSRPLRVIGSGAPVRELGIASTFASQDIADELREEIGALSRKGELASVVSRWSMFPQLMAESTDALNAERTRVRQMALGIAALALALIMAGGLSWRLGQRNRSLAESEARFRSLTDAAFEGVMTHDNFRILDANIQFAKLFGYDSPDELIGDSGIQLLDEASVTEVRKRFGSGVYLRPIEVTGIRKDGSTFRAETQGCDSVFDGKRVRVVAMRDLSERLRLEAERTKLERDLAQSQKMESIGRLAGGVAHDFNNLLTVINGYCHLLLKDRDLPAKVLSRIENVRKAGELAADLTSQLLAFSRRQVVEPRPVNLNLAVGEIRDMLARVLPANIELSFCLQEDLSWVMADAGQMHQVLMNLSLNARDAMPNGGTLLIETSNVYLDSSYVATHPEVVEGPCVLLAVSDTGMGMSDDVLKHAFEPFYTTKAHGDGTGLGLATVYGIVRQSGGWIWVYSEPGRGSSFKIYLPMLAKAEQAQERTSPVHETSGETILVVDDQPELRFFVEEVLCERGYKVLCAGSGKEALQLAAEFSGTIHLLLTDVVMPGISGKELADRLHRERPETKVLYMSGYTENVIVNRGVLKPGIAYLPKPLTPDSVLQKVGEVLGRNF